MTIEIDPDALDAPAEFAGALAPDAALTLDFRKLAAIDTARLVAFLERLRAHRLELLGLTQHHRRVLRYVGLAPDEAPRACEG